MASLTLFVRGVPQPQGSKHARPIYRGSAANGTREFTGKVALVESAAGLGSWREAIRCAARQTTVLFPRGVPVELSLEFVLYRPLSTPKTRTPAAVKKPDLSKLVRAVEDALTSAGAYADDSQIVKLCTSKRLAGRDEIPGVHIDLREACG